jgi:hypothetical protein
MGAPDCVGAPVCVGAGSAVLVAVLAVVARRVAADFVTVAVVDRTRVAVLIGLAVAVDIGVLVGSLVAVAVAVLMGLASGGAVSGTLLIEVGTSGP